MVDVYVSLIYRALVALDHEIASCGAEPSKPGPGVSFALAYLYVARAGQDRKPYDDFWRKLVEVDNTTWSEHDKRYRRSTQLTGSMHAILRSLGLPATPGVFNSIARGRGAGAVRQSHVRLFWDEVERFHSRGVPARRR